MEDWLDDFLNKQGGEAVDKDWDYGNNDETEDVTLYTDENGDIWDSEGRKVGSKKTVTKKTVVTVKESPKIITTTTVETVKISGDKSEDKKERKIAEGQKDLEGHDIVLNQIAEGEREIGLLCKEIRELFKKHLLIKDDNVIDVPYATVISHMFPGDTLWTACVGQSSGGKTEILRSIGERRTAMVYPVSRITQGGILSGAKGDVGMAYDANNKIVLIKDLVTAITSKNSETVFSQLREMFDGSISITSGLGDEDGKKSSKEKSGIKVTLIAGVTPDALSGDTIFKSALGERFLYYMFPKFEMGDIKELAKRRTRGSSDDGKRKAIHALADKLLLKVFELRLIHFAKDTDVESFIEDDYFEWLYRLSAFTAYLRRTVGWSWNKYSIDTIGTEEAPHRLQKELTKMSVGLRIVKMKSSIEDDEVKNVIMKICMDSIPHRRFAGLRIFMILKKRLDKAKQGYVKGAVIKERLTLEFGFSKSTAKTVISELVEMNVLQASGENNEKGDYTILELNENFINDFGQILDDLIVYADKYKPLRFMC
jgi:hypothetical protein